MFVLLDFSEGAVPDVLLFLESLVEDVVGNDGVALEEPPLLVDKRLALPFPAEASDPGPLPALELLPLSEEPRVPFPFPEEGFDAVSLPDLEPPLEELPTLVRELPAFGEEATDAGPLSALEFSALAELPLCPLIADFLLLFALAALVVLLFSASPSTLPFPRLSFLMTLLSLFKRGAKLYLFPLVAGPDGLLPVLYFLLVLGSELGAEWMLFPGAEGPPFPFVLGAEL